MDPNNTILTIGVGTFNHEKFITRCLESILEQKVNFKYDIVISDAGSTDMTVSILTDYAKKYPTKIRLLTSDHQINLLENISKGMLFLKGKYLAIIDGDDSYTYKYKLQKQIDFLESNPDFSGCFHDAVIIPEIEEYDPEHEREETSKFYYKYSDIHHYNTIFTTKDAIARKIIPTASLVFRNIDFNPVIDLIKRFKAWSPDWVLHLKLLENNKKFYYFPEPWSIYNDHSGGITKLHGNIGFHISNFDILNYLLNVEYFKQLKSDILKSALHEMKIIIRNENILLKIKSIWFKNIYIRHLYNLHIHYIYNLHYLFKNIKILKFLFLSIKYSLIKK